MLNKKIAHLTSAHPRYDTRIFIKMCNSLYAAGYDTALIVADGKGSELKNGIAIIDVGVKTGGRISRMTKTVYKVYKAALKLDADIFHLHDPELLLVALLLKRKGKKVVFDAHEDLPVQILSKPYLHPFFAKVISKIAHYYESFLCKRIDAVVAATPFIRDKFLKINSTTVDVNNYPKVEEFISIDTANFSQRESCCYIGGITKVRGIYEIVDAMVQSEANGSLLLAGNFLEKQVQNDVIKLEGWNKVDDLGWLNREDIQTVLGRSFAGLVTLHPIENYKDALPVKMFEYMASGIPVIASNITLWEDIVIGDECGICVDPYSSKEISDAMNYLANNLEVAKAMGARGRDAVLKKYNWQIEEEKLFQLYSKLI
ncbi:glycosyltransferase family 4 protein [Pseudoalteromonas sp. NEC-BIFX-2020_015]|uniref:glycosyltransferase family 4 protein n=1 Tax=Pseudoalteromonas sp. NEC-BIFX-2020_015 TaxID=2729544 RepID=UPI001461597D|nr:glycosyltransferase family 4 protein [Pseudoalteromonas sp. NEC-BIFX-2020_015]NMR26815.1 glycosyltransferase family 4 protein [Pseudoalteromonas sp. NEC-BIFX-2020_015]